MELRRGLLMQMAGGGDVPIPSFMNHLESGTITLESGGNTWISLQDIALPKGILVFSNDFDLITAKTNKDVLGAYGALYLAGTDTLTPQSSGYYAIAYGAFYFVNWGQNNDQGNPTARSSRTESRGIPYFDPANKRFYFHGFGTGEYDFKHNITYNWIAWD